MDNLKLGYGGTKSEMERLIADANAVKEANGEMANLSIDSFADVVEAIHTMQEEMGIAGATAAEAEGTISGSVSAMKAAWQNLVVGISDENADFEGLVVNFVDAVGTVAENIIPRIEQALNGAGALIERLVPVIMDKIPEIVNDMLPRLLESGVNVVQSIVNGIGQNRKALVDGAISAVNTLIDGIGDMAPDIVVTGVMLILELAAGLIKAIPELVSKIPEIIGRIVKGFAEALPEIKEIGKNIIRGLWDGIVSLATWIKDKVSGFFSGIVDSVKGLLGIHSPSRVFAGIGGYMAEGLGEGWEDEYSKVKRDIENGLDFGSASISVNASSNSGSVQSERQSAESTPIQIVVQSVLDGRVIGETAYQYSLNKQKAYGV